MRNAIFLAFMFSLMSGSLVAVSDEVTYPCGYYKRPTAETASQTCIADENGDCNVTQYYASGELQQVCPLSFGIENGTEFFYRDNPNTLMYELPWLNGKKDGKTVSYRDDGTISNETNYKNNQKSGRTISYDGDGKPQESGYYRDDWKDGTWAVHSGGKKYIKCYSLGDELAKSTGFWGDKCESTSRVIESREEMAVRLCKGNIDGKMLVLMNVWARDTPPPDSCMSENEITVKLPSIKDNILLEDNNSGRQNDLDDTLRYLKSECEKLGYDQGTKQHGDCVLKLLDKS